LFLRVSSITIRKPDLAAAIRAAALNTFMTFSVPLVAAASEAEAVRLAYDAMTIGADAIMKAERFTVLVRCWQ